MRCEMRGGSCLDPPRFKIYLLVLYSRLLYTVYSVQLYSCSTGAAVLAVLPVDLAPPPYSGTPALALTSVLIGPTTLGGIIPAALQPLPHYRCESQNRPFRYRNLDSEVLDTASEMY